jgi:hypothetical protein
MPSTQANDDACGRKGAACAAIFQTMPTTLEGLAALFRRMAEPRYAAGKGAYPATLIQDMITNHWCDDAGEDPENTAAAQWMLRLELAVRRIAAGMPTA